MANPLKTKRREDLGPEVRRERPLALVQAVPWLIVIVLLALAAWLGWRAFVYQEEGDPVGSAMLAFEKQNSLTVFSSRFEVIAESEDTRGVLGVPVLRSRQAMIIPATVEYRVDLSQVGRERIDWNAETQQLTVRLPQLQTTRPNLDEAQARVFQDGVFITRDASRDLSQNNSRQAERKASAFAKNPEVLALARTAAKEAVRQNLAIPLQIAGYDRATVQVTFEGE
ncbi:DUF4230 domain-containing protein [Pelagerythrobacter aerophilus]|uniref:DUF4230 domain-containing protein n=1 Tax=Pelagerythrobacter aerophilus TaxID=2306995 RepID=A0A418NEX9_9SPHN|nr:DUF4230 domain-containing protein [Pelagerythrobacter aerophilus]